MGKQSGWFRVYEEVVNDPKVQRLGDELFKTWINLLCLGSANGGKLPSVEDMAYALRLDEAEMQRRLELLAAAELFERRRGVWMPHNWDGRQYKSDCSTERVTKYRDAREANGLSRSADYFKFRPALASRDGRMCVYCGATNNLVVDHILPISLGGTDDLDNLCLACKACNAGKAGRTPETCGMVIRVESARLAYLRYLSRSQNKPVTVTHGTTVTPSDTDQKQKQIRTDPEADADALPPLALAHKIAVECLLPRNPRMLEAIAGAIEYCVKADGKTKNQAVEFLLPLVDAERKRGSPANVYWFDDRKWLKGNDNGANHGGKPSKIQEGIEQTRRLIAARVGATDGGND